MNKDGIGYCGQRYEDFIMEMAERRDMQDCECILGKISGSGLACTMTISEGSIVILNVKSQVYW